MTAPSRRVGRYGSWWDRTFIGHVSPGSGVNALTGMFLSSVASFSAALSWCKHTWTGLPLPLSSLGGVCCLPLCLGIDPTRWIGSHTYSRYDQRCRFLFSQNCHGRQRSGDPATKSKNSLHHLYELTVYCQGNPLFILTPNMFPVLTYSFKPESFFYLSKSQRPRHSLRYDH